ncbi:MAG: hypothetical protein Q8P26_02900 [Candidatus Levybacteria bacterium]|nr:hypothetical protein [Candidatus Levybacteria bacterium]
MRKILSSAFFSLLFMFATYFLSQPSYAQQIESCPISITPSNISASYDGNIVIAASSGCSFPTTIEYSIIFCPRSLNYSIQNCIVNTKTSDDSKTIIANPNISYKPNSYSTSLGEDHPGGWTVAVCGQDNFIRKLCNNLSPNNENLKAIGYFTVGAVSTPTPPPDLPKIDALAQAKCTFEIGEEVELTATNIQPNTTYEWWWNGNIRTSHAGRSDTDDTELTFTIPGYETTETGIRNVCVDKDEGLFKLRRKGQAEQCISLNFLSQTPTETTSTSCTALNAGTKLWKSHGEKAQNAPPPQCASWTYLDGKPVPTHKLDENGNETTEKITQEEYIQLYGPSLEGLKCKQVRTAIGLINTEPVAFIRSIFSIVLGLSGGIALILIIISGYRFMVSQGNPEVIKGAQQQLMGAIIGLLFIIFSFVILQVVGVDILKIPGFG